ncbi:hypothetical protein DFH27DRAFT_610926 [Peziza echinospora]|nr:hypothetical protein DFH27DRAFT_610926 [Peziza echinospora]
MARRAKARSTRRIPVQQNDSPGVMFFAATIVAVIIAVALSLQTMLPSQNQASLNHNRNSQSILGSLKHGLVEGYYRGRGMVMDDDGIWRDASEIRYDDYSGRPVWIGGGLRKTT